MVHDIQIPVAVGCAGVEWPVIVSIGLLVGEYLHSDIEVGLTACHLGEVMDS